MQTNSYDNWMRRPLSCAVCPTPDIWPDEAPPTFGGHQDRRRSRRGSNIVPRVHYKGRPTDTLDRETTMNEEKARILKMLEDKKITADEAMKLLDALDRTGSRPSERELRKKWLHIRVEKDGRQTVNLKLPLALLKFGFKFAPHAGAMRRGRSRVNHERAVVRAERAKARAEKIRAKIEKRMRDKFGDETEINLNGVIDEALEEAGLGVPPVPPVPPVHSAHGSPLDDILNGDFDLDLDKILEMAQDADFDGKILDVYDDEDDEHVRITLE
jgi:hypothetical protein